MFLSSRQKEILAAQGKDARFKGTADQPDRLNMNRSTMHSINSNIFNNFREALEAMDEYFPVFEGRFKRHEPEVWDRMRSLRLKMKKMTK